MNARSAALSLCVLASITWTPAYAYNAFTDFSISAGNPNSPWSYGTTGVTYGAAGAAFGGFAPLVNAGHWDSCAGNWWCDADAPIDAWYDSLSQDWGGGYQTFNAPLIGKNTSGQENPALPWPLWTVRLPSNALWLVSTGPDTDGIGKSAMLRWTTPADGSYDIGGSFWITDSNSTLVGWAVLKNGALLDSFTGQFQQFNFHPGGPERWFLDRTELLAAGDTLDFLAYWVPNTAGAYSAALDLIIAPHVTAAPVPAAVWLFAPALGMLGLARRRVPGDVPPN